MGRGLIRGLRNLMRPDAADRDVRDELKDFLARAEREGIERGLSAAQASRAARLLVGSVPAVEEEVRSRFWEARVETFGRDVRYALRMLWRSPGFSAVAILTLALGIGANTALFSVADTVLFKPLPVVRPNELVLFGWSAEPGRIPPISVAGVSVDPVTGRGTSTAFSQLTFQRFQQETKTLSGVFAFASARSAPSAPGLDDFASGQLVSGNYFTVLGTTAHLGRLLSTEDDRADAPLVAVISHRFWQRRFGGDQSVLGQTLRFDPAVATIVGVTPAGFSGTGQLGDDPDFFIPLSAGAPFAGNKFATKLQTAWVWPLRVFGRIKPGVTLNEVQRELQPLFAETAREAWTSKKGSGTIPPALPRLDVASGAEGLTESRRGLTQSLAILGAISLVVLLSVGVNLANLMLARAQARRDEMALRIAIGANRSRLLQQLLTESIVLSACGAAVGVLLASWGKDVFLAWLSRVNPLFVLTPSLDGRVLAGTGALTLLAGVGIGLAPALRATRVDPNPALKDQSGQTGVRRSVGARALVATQMALSLVLVVAAGLLMQTLRNLESADVGFDMKNLLLFRATVPLLKGPSAPDPLVVFDEVADRLSSVPGVRAAAYSQNSLLGGDLAMPFLSIPGKPKGADEDRTVFTQGIGEGFLATAQIPILQGRNFEHADRTRRVAVVNQTLARQYFPGENPIGRQIAITKDALAPEVDETNRLEIVGVVRDAKDMTVRAAPLPTVFQPMSQTGAVQFTVRTSSDPLPLVRSIQEAIRGVNAGVAVSDFRTQAGQAAMTFAQERHLAMMATTFGAVAIVLTMIGVYGLLSYGVERRRKEFGIRMALGATPRHVLGSVLGETIVLVVGGIIIGVACAAGLGRFIQSRLYGLAATDPLTSILASALLLTVAVLAAILPARRATKVDPLVTLKV